MAEHNDILKNSGGELTEEKLAAYLDGSLSNEEQREVELLLSEEGMESDVLDGLMHIDKNEAKVLAHKINYKLQIDIKQKKYRNIKMFSDNKWSVVAVCVILILIAIGFYIISIM